MLLTYFFYLFVIVKLLAYHQVVNELENYVSTNLTFAKLLNETFVEGSKNSTINTPTYIDMYIFFDSYITIIGNYSNNTFQIILDQFASTSTGSKLFIEGKSQSWIMKFFMAKKEFADSFNSTSIIPVWEEWYKINMSEYIIPENGYQSFNDFFTRQINLNLRPISSPNNNTIITSPCDGTINWIEYNLTSNIEFDVKNNKYNLSQMLNNNEYFINKFRDGTAVEIMLHQYNYHRYHSCVAGYVDEIDIIGGYILVDALWINQSIICFYANNNVRGITYINSDKLGYVAQIYVGMQLYNSINFDVSPGVFVNKGDPIGYFKYGGSAIVLLFEKDIIQNLAAKIGQTVQMGQLIAIANTKTFANKHEL